MKSVPKRLLKSRYRREMWSNASRIIREIEKVIPVSSAYALGSFMTKKRRPADVDFIFLLKTKKRRKSKWSADFVIAPDNKYGEFLLKDAKLWMKQKYGRKSAVIRLK